MKKKLKCHQYHKKLFKIILLYDLTKHVTINNKILRFLSTKLNKVNHFIGIFETNDDLYF